MHVCACVCEREIEMVALLHYTGILEVLGVWPQVFLLYFRSARSMALPQDQPRATAVPNLDSFMWLMPRSKTWNKYRLKGHFASLKVFDSFNLEKKNPERST